MKKNNCCSFLRLAYLSIVAYPISIAACAGGSNRVPTPDEIEQPSHTKPPSKPANSRSKPANSPSIKALSMGSLQVCAVLKSDQLDCWGTHPTLGTDSRVEAVFPASYDTCFLSKKGNLQCELTRLSIGNMLTAATASGDTLCGLNSQGEVQCWGQRSSRGFTKDLNGARTSMIALASYDGLLCAEMASGSSVYCGILDDASSTSFNPSTKKTPLVGPFAKLLVGIDLVCGLSEKTLHCYNRTTDKETTANDIIDFAINESDELCTVSGSGMAQCEYTPEPIADNARLITTRGRENCVAHNDDTISCRGEGQDIKWTDAKPWIAVTGSCFLAPDGTQRCLTNFQGSTVDGETDPDFCIRKSLTATSDCQPSSASKPLHSLVYGHGFKCGLDPAGTILCEGRAPNMPTQKLTALVGGYDYFCGLQEDDTATCWGNGPTPPTRKFKKIAAVNSAGCGVDKNDKVSCWGEFPDGVSPDGSRFSSVELGQSSTDHIFWCGLPQSRKLECNFDISRLPEQKTVGFSLRRPALCTVTEDQDAQCLIKHVDSGSHLISLRRWSLRPKKR